MKKLYLKIPLLLILFICSSSFLNAQEFTTVGSANMVSSNTYQLTPAQGNQGGAIWSHNYIDINNDLVVSAEIYLGSNDGGADGIAFVLQDLCAGTGSSGGGIGYLGINPSLAIEFDTYQNGEYGDPNEDHVALQKNGVLNHSSSSNLAGPISLTNLEDGNYHPVEISWNATSQNIKVELDGVVLFDQYVGDIANTIFSGNNLVLFGFTAATGGANNDQRVRVLSVSSVEVSQYNITSPSCVNNNGGNIQLTPSGKHEPYTYNWSNGSTDQNQSGLSAGTYTVTILDANSCESVLEIVVPVDYDLDGDGYSAIGSDCGTMNDCDDNNPEIYPGAPELCDGLDTNCDGVIPATEIDDDGDGYSECQGDCDDTNAAINPGATEIPYNGIDEDCSPATPDDDMDMDGFNNDVDCNDNNPNIYPGATELCDGIDNDCDGEVETSTSYLVPLSDTNLISTCASDNFYTTGNSAIQWTSTSTDPMTSGEIEFLAGVDCNASGVRNVLLNGVLQSSETFTNQCGCSPNPITHVVTLNPADYNVGGVNVLTIESPLLFGLRNLTNSGSDVYARVCVEYMTDVDSDGDGVNDDDDNCPNTANADQANNDGDAQGDICDDDDDNDGVDDTSDAFPLDDTEDTDTDSDGTGNNADTDDDDDGFTDADETAAGTDPLDENDFPVADLCENDIEAPVITCPQPIIINTSPGVCEAANVELVPPTVTDNCSTLEATFSGGIDVPAFFVGERGGFFSSIDIDGNREVLSNIPNADGVVFVSSTKAIVSRFSSVGNNLLEVDITNGSAVPLVNVGGFVQGMDINFEGKLLLCNEGLRKIQMLDLSTLELTDVVTGLNRPIDVVEQNSTTLLISEYNLGRILKHDLSTNTTTVFSSGFTNPTDIFIEDDGNLIVAENGGAVSRVDAVTGTRSVIANIGGGPFGPHGIAKDFNDNIYVAVFSQGRVVKIDGQTNAVTPFATGFSQPVFMDRNPANIFPVGDTVITWTATDEAGNTSTCEQTITVVDNEAPRVNNTTTLDIETNVQADCSLIITAPNAQDNCAGLIIGTTQDPLEYTEIGEYVVTWLFDDGNGNVSSVIQNIVISEGPDCPPEQCIVSVQSTTVNGASSVQTCEGSTNSFLFESEFTGNGNLSVQWQVLNASFSWQNIAGATNPTLTINNLLQGNYNYRVIVNSDFSADCSAVSDNVTIFVSEDSDGCDTADETAPIITLLGANPLELNIGDTYEEFGAIATDDIDGDLTESITADASLVDRFNAGSYAVTYNVSDAAGNAATEVIRMVNVLEPDDPCDNDTGAPTAIWSGASDTDWTNAANWNNAPSLSTTSAITIPTGLTNYPVLKYGQDLYISACSTVTIESGASLMVNPNVVVSNDGTITNNGTMTFGSNEKGSAYIGSGSGAFMGDFTVERYIPANRAFRQLASPVTTSTPISLNWQQDTHITGSDSGANGFDAQPTGNPSMYTFNNMDYNYVTMANTVNTNLLPNTMYHILVRGDRSIDITDNNTVATETTLRATGVLTAENDGSSTLAITVPEQRFIAVANPFQAPLDMNTVLTTNASNINPIYYWVWDPNLNTRGGYAQITASDGEPVPSDSNANQYLQAGQAGWVYTLGAGDTSISFTQASKATSVMETEVFKTAGKTNVSLGRINLSLLYESNASVNNLGSADGLSIRFDTEGNNGIDYYDAPKITNLDENFATNTEGNLFSTEYRAAPLNAEEIQLEINTYRHTNYTIVAEGVTRQGATAYLFDAYTNVSTEIPQNGTVNYAYTIDSGIPASIAGDRFKINFASIALSVDTYDMEEILLYPNPTSIGEFYLNIPIGMDDLEVTIYNALGAKLLNETGLSGGRKATIDTSLILSQGMYFVKLSSHGKTITKKLNIN